MGVAGSANEEGECIHIVACAVASENAKGLQLAMREMQSLCSRRPDCSDNDVNALASYFTVAEAAPSAGKWQAPHLFAWFRNRWRASRENWRGRGAAGLEITQRGRAASSQAVWAPASVGACVMERMSPSELWRMAMTG